MIGDNQTHGAVTPERFQRIERLYHSVLEREENQRAAFLREACAGDDSLRQEVESLMAKEQRGEQLLESPPWKAPVEHARDAAAGPEHRQIGPYQVLFLLGAGGMGEVYRASDTRLKRDVALKILPEAFARDPGRMARFRREAELLASLNHPNIAQIYGVEERALVMELVEGESLESLIKLGPMAFDEAWKIALQMADAMEYAHGRGVVHRDLKPANVKVTPEGVVKLLDFGLAKAFTDQREASPSGDETETAPGGTEPGMILGSAAYMAPEQARGKRVDKRADIWSWGVVLYELLTGERLFKADDFAATLAQVLTKEPDLERAPAKVRKLLGRCLEKDPKQRLRDIGEARYLLEVEVGPATRSPAWMGWIAAGVLFVALGIGSFLSFHQTPPNGPVQRYTIALPDNTTNLHSFAISPDGRFVALAAVVKGKRQLWLRPLDALQAQPMPGTDDATYPFWSPDSGYIGFFAQGKLKKIAASGGPAQSLCDAPNARGGSWNREDVIVFSPRGGPGVAIQRVSAGGGPQADVTRANSTSRFPVFLPDGRHFLYLVAGVSAEQNGVHLSSLDGGRIGVSCRTHQA
jgi:serine/threonine protein kinase